MVPRPARIAGGLATLALPVCVSLFTSKLSSGHDANEYLPRMVEFHENIAHGILLPRWAPDFSHGAGQPLFLFNPPMFYYLAELWHLLGFGYRDGDQRGVHRDRTRVGGRDVPARRTLLWRLADGSRQPLIFTPRTLAWTSTSDPHWPNSLRFHSSHLPYTDSARTRRPIPASLFISAQRPSRACFCATIPRRFCSCRYWLRSWYSHPGRQNHGPFFAGRHAPFSLDSASRHSSGFPVLADDRMSRCNRYSTGTRLYESFRRPASIVHLDVGIRTFHSRRPRRHVLCTGLESPGDRSRRLHLADVQPTVAAIAAGYGFSAQRP